MPLFISDIFLFSIFFLTSFVLLLSYVAAKSNSLKIDNLALFISYIITLLFYGLREPGTTDIKMYLSNFDALNNFVSFNWGIGFYVLMKSIKFFSSDHYFFIFASSFLLSTFVLLFICLGLKGKPYKSLMMVSLMYGWYMLDLSTNTYRQGISLPFIMLSLYFISRREYLKFVIGSSVAISLHWGALIPAVICFVSGLLCYRVVLIKYVSAFALVIFMFSFFFDLKIAENIANNPMTSALENVFVGVNISSKVASYLNSEVDGSSFYDISLLRKIKFTIEALIPLAINTIFLFRMTRMEDHPLKTNSLYLSSSLFIALLNVYAVSLISMAWFFRNFYWIPIASSLCLIMILYSSRSSKRFSLYLISYIIYIVALSILTIWTSELLNMSYP